jgi:ABC-2 type transport system ATP-binding protein
LTLTLGQPSTMGAENLALMTRLYHLAREERQQRAAALLERFDLLDVAGRPPATYSGGMRRRLDIAMTLIGDTRLIFLDEPTRWSTSRSGGTARIRPP